MMDQIRLTYQLGLWFNKTLFSYYRSTYKGLLGAVQVHALDELYVGGALRPQEISDHLNVPKQHASKILARLNDLGFVRSEADPSDGRSRVFTLTDSGKALVESHIRESNSHFQHMLDTLDEEARQRLRAALEEAYGILADIK